MQIRQIIPSTSFDFYQVPSIASISPLLLLAIAVGVAPASEGQRRLIAVSGQDPDGDGPIDMIDHFTDGNSRYSASINNLRDVAFTARSTLGNGERNQSVWRFHNDQFQLIMIGGSEAPGTSGARFVGVQPAFYSPSMNDNGDVVVRESLDLGIGDTHADNDEGIWSTTITPNGSLGLVVRKGDIAPGTGGARFGGGVSNTFGRPALSATGVVVFSASLQRGDGINETNDTGIWSYRDGQLSLLARAGAPTPGGLDGVFLPFFYPTIDNSRPIVVGQNDHGDVVFRAKILAPFMMDSIWKTTNGELELVVMDGQVAPGTAGETFDVFGFNSSYPVVISIHGSVPFIATTGNRDRIWIDKDDGFHLLLSENDLLPGSDNAFFTQFGNPVDTNAGGDIAFHTWIDPGDGSNELIRQIWAILDGELVHIAGIGDSIRGTNGYVVSGFQASATLNDQGDVVFEGWLTRLDGTTDRALYAYSSVLQEVVLVAEVGESIDVSQAQDGSDVREVRLLQFDDEVYPTSSYAEPRDGSTGLNDHGDIAYTLSFSGASAVFVTTLRSCKADLDGDLDVDFFDVSIYLNQYLSADPAADIDGVPGLNFFDISQFLSEFNEGCPVS